MPLLHNYHTQGKGWQEHGITSDLVLAYNATIAAGSQALWEFAQSVIQDAVAKGYLREGSEGK
jgi:putative hydrolase of HD superfamily